MAKSQTLFEKIWNAHVVSESPDVPTVLYIDLHLVHEVTSPQAFDGLRKRGLKVRRPERTVATMDHSTPTANFSLPLEDEMADRQIRCLQDNCREFGVQLYDIDDPDRGIVHVIGPELGLTQPGMTIVCGDSHTATHGAFGALAFGIGTSEVEHVLATQCLLQNRPKTFQVNFEGQLSKGVSAKDMILALIAKMGVGGGTGTVIEYTGRAVRALSMEERMTLCNMTIEGGARAGMVAPDDTTFEYLAGRPFAPQGENWNTAVDYWRSLSSDPEACFDKTINLDVSDLQPMITYGTNPGMGIPINQPVPDPSEQSDPSKRAAQEKALRYMDLQPGSSLLGHPVDVVFLGSCNNSRISDLRLAASLLGGHKIAEGVRLLVVPGSESVRRQAEAEGLDKVFKEAGGEWRNAGCSMCIAMNGDHLEPGQYAVSTSNRNFEGRQGKGGRTFLASPLTATAAAINGGISDPRTFL
ncbi:MAG: 3-isopropylmalate dehydratase large subunit [Anaerolineales bacterium]|nr:3-isopropylmalate dehydratase large subunit [Anaerolineales bacterium]